MAEEIKPKAKITAKQGIAFIVLIALIVIIVLTCSSSDDTETVVDVQVTEQLKTDSMALVSHISGNTTMLEGMSFEVSEFDAKNCRIRVTVPEQNGKTGADVIGKSFCTITAKWLAENGYKVGHEGVYTSCYVYSPYEGVTGKDGLIISWGNAKYDALTDSVEWEWKE